MKLKERISWLMGTVQQSLFPHLDECLPVPLSEREKNLIKILELIQIEKFVPNSVNPSNRWGDQSKSVKRLPEHLLPRQSLSISIPVL